MMLSEAILLKRGIRSDALWMHRVVYRSPLRYIPLFLDTWALMRSQYWSRETLAHYQDVRIAELLSEARAVPYWKRLVDDAREKFNLMEGRTLLSQLPVTNKHSLQDVPFEESAFVPLIRSSEKDHTSGSTGMPFHFYHDWGSVLRSCAVTERIFRTVSRSRLPIIYMRARERHGFTFFRHVWFFVRSATSIRFRIEALLSLNDRFRRGYILYGYTSWVLELARIVESTKKTLHASAIMVAGEHMTPADYEYLRTVFGVPICSLYASRELGFLGFECGAGLMHISEEWALVEVLDDHDQPLPLGTEGRIVVTTFDNRVMPFIRYDSGDIGAIRREQCSCGRTARTLRFVGRVAETIHLEDDRAVPLLDVAYAIGSFRNSIRKYQIIQTSMISCVFKVVPGSTFDEQKEYIESAMLRLMHPRLQVTWQIVDDIPAHPNGKAIYFVRDFLYSI